MTGPSLAEQSARFDAEALAAVPTVEQTPGLLYVWELVEGYHELYRGEAGWLLLEHAQRSRVAPPKGEAPRIFLRLEGPVERKRLSAVEPGTGALVFGREVRIHRGPVILARADVLVRARPRATCAVCGRFEHDELHDGPADLEGLHLFDPDGAP